MIKIRRGTFETNSSSTHSITICKKDEYDRFAEGELLFIKEEGKFLKPEEVETFYKRRALKERFEVDYENGIISYKDEKVPYSGYKDREAREDELADKYIEDLATITEEELESVKEEDDWTENPIDYETYCEYTDCYEYFEKEYESEQGDNIVAFGYYGCEN